MNDSESGNLPMRPHAMTDRTSSVWAPYPGAYRQSEVSSAVGHGEAVWNRTTEELLRWKVKTASGFTVNAPGPVSRGVRVQATAGIFGLKVVEPVELVCVVREQDGVGFAYRTLPGHPVSGEEAFILHRCGDDIHLTIRSLTRAAPQQPWRALYPLLVLLQRVVRQRYLRSLR